MQKNIVARGIAALIVCAFSGHCAAVITPVAAAAQVGHGSQDAHAGKAVASATVAGTWHVTAMDHQVALVLEQDGTKLTGTLMTPDMNLQVEGTFTDRVLTLTVKTTPASEAGGTEEMGISITGRLQDDGTLAGVLRHATVSSEWTAERLK